MKKLMLYASLAVMGSLALPMQAAEMKDMPMKPGAGNSVPNQVHKGQGTVNKVDIQAGKVNLTHGPIQSLGWKGMTMDFPVKDKKILAGVQPGQRVDFEIVKESEERHVITRINPVK